MASFPRDVHRWDFSVASASSDRSRGALYKERGLRPRIRPPDRLLWAPAGRGCGPVEEGAVLRPAGRVLEWQSKRFRDYWRDLSQSRPAGRPKMAPELRTLIQANVVGEPDVGIVSDSAGAEQAWDRRRQIHSGAVSTEGR